MKPRSPRPKQQTERQRLIEVLQDAPLMDARELSGAARISEKEVYEHLQHIAKSVRKDGLRLTVVPAICRKCEFSFEKRGQFSKPGRCPKCKGERIEPPAYQLEEA